MDKAKILIISLNTWDVNLNSGNTFSILFSEYNSDDISHLYCKETMPYNNVCNNYYQITDREIVKSIVTRRPCGRALQTPSTFDEQPMKAQKNNSITLPHYPIIYLLRDIIWKFGIRDNERLIRWVKDRNPDAIFLLCCNSIYTYDIALFIHQQLDIPLTIFFADDYYNNIKFNLSPNYWIRQIFLRSITRKTAASAKTIYVISQSMKKEYSTLFNKKCNILYKGGRFLASSHSNEVIEYPLKVVYTGNITDGRWKTLAIIGQALNRINQDAIKAQLYIYTQNKISEKVRRSLEINNSVFIMGGIPSSEIRNVLLDADIVVHVESFELKSRLATRLSFSTKIVDYLESGRCVFAAGWSKAASIEYLIQHDAAIVATDNREIETNLRALIDNPQLILEYGNKAWECGKRNHQIEQIQQSLYSDLSSCRIKTTALL